MIRQSESESQAFSQPYTRSHTAVAKADANLPGWKKICKACI